MKLLPGLWCVVLLLIFVVSLHVSTAEEGKLPLETSVKNLRPAASPSAATGMRPMRRRDAAPTTPGAKYPQYQLGHQQRQNPEARDVENPRIRFFLTLPDGPTLIEATVTIDGLPFQMVRQQRVERLLKENSVEKEVATADFKTTEKNSNPDSDVAVGTKAASNLQSRLRHTMKLTGEAPTTEEVYWLLSNWFDGPTILQLNDNFQRFRANQRPGFVILDRNRDGTVSAEEMKLAVRSFQECDLNQDGLIQFTEISVAAADPRNPASDIESGNMISFLPDDASAAVTYQRLVPSKPPNNAAAVIVPRFDINRNGQFDGEELKALRETDPDLKMSIDFNTTNPEKSRIALTAVASEFKNVVHQAKIDRTGITIPLGGVPVIFAAVQMQPSDQISIGAVKDGYPLLPSLDLNDDGRLTIRELRGSSETLKSFDRNQDGALTVDEAPSPIRVCFGLGACIHRELAGIRSVHRKETSAPMIGPEWFTRMDRNADNDLTRGEFPGTDQQFKELDANADELISAEEALEFDKKIEAANRGDNRPVVIQFLPTPTDSTSIEKTKP